MRSLLGGGSGGLEACTQKFLEKISTGKCTFDLFVKLYQAYMLTIFLVILVIRHFNHIVLVNFGDCNKNKFKILKIRGI